MSTGALNGAPGEQPATPETAKPSQRSGTSTADIKRSLAAFAKDTAMRPLLEHPSTRDVHKSLGTDLTELSDTMLRLSETFDAIHLKYADKTVVFTMAEMLHLLYSYIINRAAAIVTIEGEGYIVRGFYESKTDAAFTHFVRKLFDTPHEEAAISSTPERAIVLEDGTTKAPSAFDVFTKRPLKFRVQTQVDRMLRPEEVAVFWFTKSAKRQGAWDAKWEYVSRSYAVCFYGDEDYEFAWS